MNAYRKEYEDEEVDDFIDELYPDGITICNSYFSASTILKNLGKTTYNCMISEMPDLWVCSECGTEFEEEDDAEECCIEEEDEDEDEED